MLPAREEDDGQVATTLHKPRLEIGAAEPLHADVKNETTDAVIRPALQISLRRRKRLDGQTGRAEQSGQALADRVVVVDDEDRRRSVIHGWGPRRLE